jgi:hypothetical protein
MGSQSGLGDRNVAFFFYYQGIRRLQLSIIIITNIILIFTGNLFEDELQ